MGQGIENLGTAVNIAPASIAVDSMHARTHTPPHTAHDSKATMLQRQRQARLATAFTVDVAPAESSHERQKPPITESEDCTYR